MVGKLSRDLYIHREFSTFKVEFLRLSISRASRRCGSWFIPGLIALAAAAPGLWVLLLAPVAAPGLVLVYTWFNSFSSCGPWFVAPAAAPGLVLVYTWFNSFSSCGPWFVGPSIGSSCGPWFGPG